MSKAVSTEFFGVQEPGGILAVPDLLPGMFQHPDHLADRSGKSAFIVGHGDSGDSRIIQKVAGEGITVKQIMIISIIQLGLLMFIL